MEDARCNLCGSPRYETHLVRGDLNLFVEGEFRLVRCSHCGLVYLDPRPTADEMAVLYGDRYDQYTGAVQDEPCRIARLERRFGLAKRCRVVLRHEQAGRLLDVGCATGDFLDIMREHPGWKVYGVEPSEFASEYARNRLQLSVMTGTLDSVHFPANSFDVVTLWNVLEHVRDPLATLRIVHRLLTNHGVLIFSTPNLDSLDARMFKSYWIGYELPRHLYVFSRRTMQKLIKRAGFRIVQTCCVHGSHAAAASSLRFWLRARMSNARLRELLGKVLFARTVRLLTIPYFFVTDRLQLSSTLTTVCRKAS